MACTLLRVYYNTLEELNTRNEKLQHARHTHVHVLCMAWHYMNGELMGTEQKTHSQRQAERRPRVIERERERLNEFIVFPSTCEYIKCAYNPPCTHAWLGVLFLSFSP